MSQVIALIPARSGSKGVIDKNIKKLGKFPLVQWSIEACKKIKTIDKIIVSTDSPEYRDLCIKYGAEVPFLRPKKISGDLSTDTDFIIHALDWLKDNESEPDLIVHIRPTTPLRDPRVIDHAIETFKSSKGFTSLRSVHQMAESAYKNFEISESGNLVSVFTKNPALDISNNARQSFQDTFIPNGYVDILSTKYIRDSGNIHGDKVMPYITETVSEIDNDFDFQYIEYQLISQTHLIKKIFHQEK